MRWARCGLVVVLAAVGGCAGHHGAVERDLDGHVVTSGDVSVFDVEVGDCLQLDGPLRGDLEDLRAVPCAAPHTQEVIALPMVESARGGYPGDEAIRRFAERACLHALARHLGVDVDAVARDFSYLLPSRDSWHDVDDRTVICLVAPTDDDPDR